MPVMATLAMNVFVPSPFVRTDTLPYILGAGWSTTKVPANDSAALAATVRNGTEKEVGYSPCASGRTFTWILLSSVDTVTGVAQATS